MKEFESVILKSLLNNPEYFGKVIPILESKHFKNIGNAKVFGILRELYFKYDKVPTVTELISSIKNIPNEEIRQEIKKSIVDIKQIDEVNNLNFLLDETVTFVKDALYLEALEVGSEGLMKRNEDLKLKAESIMDKRAHIHIDDDLGLEFDDLDKMVEYFSERNVGIKTDSKEFNKRLGSGFLPGTLSLFASASGGGKSLMIANISTELLKKNKNILLVSLEMSDKETMKRIYANALDLPINSFSDLSRTKGELDKLERPITTQEQIVNAYNNAKMSGTLGKLFIKEYAPGTFSSVQLESLIKDFELQKDIKFDIVFVDYLGIMKSDRLSPSAGLYSYIKSIAEELRAVAIKTKLPIISAQQLNRSAVNNKEADNSSISDSLGSVMTADFIMFLLQNEEMKQNSEICMKVTKNRFNGRTDTWIMGVDYEKMRFIDLENDFGEVRVQSTNTDFSLFGESQVKKIEAQSWQGISDADNAKVSKVESVDDIFKELGL